MTSRNISPFLWNQDVGYRRRYAQRINAALYGNFHISTDHDVVNLVLDSLDEDTERSIDKFIDFHFLYGSRFSSHYPRNHLRQLGLAIEQI